MPSLSLFPILFLLCVPKVHKKAVFVKINWVKGQEKPDQAILLGKHLVSLKFYRSIITREKPVFGYKILNKG